MIAWRARRDLWSLLSRRGATVLEAFLILSGSCRGLAYVLRMSVKIERARDRSLRHVWILLTLRRIAQHIEHLCCLCLSECCDGLLNLSRFPLCSYFVSVKTVVMV